MRTQFSGLHKACFFSYVRLIQLRPSGLFVSSQSSILNPTSYSYTHHKSHTTITQHKSYNTNQHQPPLVTMFRWTPTSIALITLVCVILFVGVTLSVGRQIFAPGYVDPREGHQKRIKPPKPAPPATV
ncbi:hypothetical protein DER45DRAFT_589973 [Fusarium avenaceum]|nr:hypothetical protein DER45DRAFT_589973 [Fusarium avenaceum]